MLASQRHSPGKGRATPLVGAVGADPAQRSPWYPLQPWPASLTPQRDPCTAPANCAASHWKGPCPDPGHRRSSPGAADYWKAHTQQQGAQVRTHCRVSRQSWVCPSCCCWRCGGSCRRWRWWSAVCTALLGPPQPWLELWSALGIDCAWCAWCHCRWLPRVCVGPSEERLLTLPCLQVTT